MLNHGYHRLGVDEVDIHPEWFELGLKLAEATSVPEPRQDQLTLLGSGRRVVEHSGAGTKPRAVLERCKWASHRRKERSIKQFISLINAITPSSLPVARSRAGSSLNCSEWPSTKSGVKSQRSR